MADSDDQTDPDDVGTTPEPAAPAAGDQSAASPEPSAGQRGDGRLLYGAIGGLATLVVVLLVVLLVVVLKRDGDDGAPAATATAPTTDVTPEVPASDEPTPDGTGVGDPTPEGTGDPAGLAAMLRLTVDNIDDLTGRTWVQQTAPEGGVDASEGFCNMPLYVEPITIDQATHLPRKPGANDLPRMTTAGMVFESEEAAEDYFIARNATAGCGEWTSGNITYEITEPPFTPTLVGCMCQNVAVHEIDMFYPGSLVVNQYAVVAQQGRFITMAFYSVELPYSGKVDVGPVVAQLIDRLVERVDQIATTT